MATYIEKFNGYIADNPNIEFERCDGTVFSFHEVNTASMSDSTESLTINGGQSNFPLAIIDTTRNLQFTFDSSEFTMDMFAMANATHVEKVDTYDVLESKLFDVETGTKIVIPYDIVPGSVKIRGFDEATEVAEGKYVVGEVKNGDETLSGVSITFNAGELAVGTSIRVAYRRKIENANVMTVKTNSTTAKGSLTAVWPVYSSGTDCTESAIKGRVHLFVPRVRVTAMPGFDSSYKSAATNGVTFTALDPKRADEKMFDLVYEEL